jgi:hypothetical protein
MAQDEKVKVRILKHVGEYSPGQVVELTQFEAEQICTPSIVNDNGVKISTFKAMLEEKAIELESKPLDIKKLTVGELVEMGKRNIVVSPQYADIDRALFKAKKAQGR